MFKRHYTPRRSTNIVFVIFRLVLSLVMFAVLLGGLYFAYKQFSGLDPLKLDPQNIFGNLIAGKVPSEVKDALSNLKISPKILGQQNPSANQPGLQASKPEDSQPLLKFLIIADSHSDNLDLEKAINQAKINYPELKFIIGLGDYTEVGTVSELKSAKSLFDASALRYFLIPGDHDLWDCRNREQPPVACFREVFGPPYQSFEVDGFKFLLLDNSDNYTGFDSDQLRWISRELEQAKAAKGIFVFIHTPLYHPSSDHIMGWVEKDLKNQAGALLFELKEAGVAKVFAGDIHYFSEYQEPKTAIQMNTIGAVTIERNPQAPRYGIVSVYGDGSSKVEDLEIK